VADFPSLPLWTDAYLADTLDLTDSEHGLYLLMLIIAWRRPDCALPDDMDALKRVLGGCCRGLHGNHFNRTVPGLLKRFFELGEDGKWHQKRLEKERDFLRKRSRNASENVRKRWAKAKSANGLADTMVIPPHPHPHPVPHCTGLASNEDSESFLPHTAPNGAEKRGSRLPQDWQPDAADRAEAARLGMTRISTAREADRFRDYWVAIPGQRGVKLDWHATWRNWCRKAIPNQPLKVVAKWDGIL
jgi:uncharacterized protein YdaU (DUF1376 family)